MDARRRSISTCALEVLRWAAPAEVGRGSPALGAAEEGNHVEGCARQRRRFRHGRAKRPHHDVGADEEEKQGPDPAERHAAEGHEQEADAGHDPDDPGRAVARRRGPLDDAHRDQGQRPEPEHDGAVHEAEAVESQHQAPRHDQKTHDQARGHAEVLELRFGLHGHLLRHHNLRNPRGFGKPGIGETTTPAGR
jgi:hypothetical protein